MTVTLANHWAAKGWEVAIATIAARDKDFYELHPSVRRIALGLEQASGGPAAAVANNVRRILALRRVLQHERPDVAVSMMATATSLLVLAARNLSVITVGSERIHPPTLPLGRVWELIRRLSYRKLDVLVAQTGASAEWLWQYAPARSVAVIPNPIRYPLAIHEPRVEPRTVSNKSLGQKMLLGVGRLVEQKGFDRLIWAFASIANRHPEWVLVLLGEGALRVRLERLARDLGVGLRVRLPGAVGNVGEWYQAADLYALTSRFEGFPNTLLEALAHGLPAVAVDCETGPREIVRHEVDGLLVPQNDPEALVAALDRLMSDGGLRARFAERAAEARERFALERIAQQWEALFKDVT